MEPWTHHLLPVNGQTIHVVEEGTGPAVLLIHGWPEFHLSWRHQISVLAAAGYRVLAPDLRGFGQSSCPTRQVDYLLDALLADMTGVLDALGIPDAVWVGHDWGGMLVWHAALAASQRVRAVVSLNTPHRARGLIRPLMEYRRAPDGRFNYMFELLIPPGSEERLMADLPGHLDFFMRKAGHDLSFWTPEVKAAWVDAFTRSGMHSVNLYRNLDENWVRAKALGGRKVEQPALMVTAENDPILLARDAAGMQWQVPKVRVENLLECGHWTQQERPGEVNRLLLDFLAGLG